MHAGGHSHDLEFCDTYRLSCEAFFECLHFCSCLLFDLASWSAGTPRPRPVCALIDRSTRLVEPHNSLSLVLQALLAPFRRLPLTTLSRESCLCTWRLSRLWTDVWISLHLCILGTGHWDLIKDLSTWLELPLQHDWNVHNSVCELPRVSVPAGSLALVFVLHDLRDFNQGGRRTELVGSQPSSASSESWESGLLHTCCACARHLPLPVHRNVVDRLHLMHLHCSRCTVWAVGTFLCNISGTSISSSMYFSSRISTCLSNCLIFACRIAVGSKLRIRHCLEDLGFASQLAQQLTCQLCWLRIEFLLAYSRD